MVPETRPPGKAFLADQGRVGHAPVPGGHHEGAVRGKGDPFRVGAAVLGQTFNQPDKQLLVSRVSRRHEFHLAIDPFPPLPFFAGGKEFVPSNGRFRSHGLTAILSRVSSNGKLRRSGPPSFVPAPVPGFGAKLSDISCTAFCCSGGQ